VPKKLSKSEFITKANDKHNNKYDYSNTIYTNNKTNIEIICHNHGNFKQRPDVHLRGQGCPDCKKEVLSEKKKMKIEKVLSRFRKIHGDKYDYSLVNYINSEKKVKIICQEHGIFKQSSKNHWSGQGCPKCGSISSGSFKKMSVEGFIKKANELHNNKYDYSLVKYINSKTKVNIICPEHGVFKKRPNNHIRNISSEGCPKCKISNGEKEIMKYLEERNIEYIFEKKFEDCVYKKRLRFDFYLPKYNTCIEYNGIQHYEPVEIFGGVKALENNKIRDVIKNKYCEENNIALLIIAHDQDINYILNKKLCI
jgi:Zn finger protein HypA/HybF involved in hydrogenase expression